MGRRFASTLLSGLVAIPHLSLYGQAQSSQADDRHQLESLDQEWVAAEVKHDEAVLNRILDDRFLMVDTAGHITVGKAAFIEVVKTFTFTAIASMIHDRIEIHGDTALIVATITTVGTDGKTSAPVRVTVTYIKRDGAWRAVAEQIGRVAQAR